jgi:DNA-binding response OmpR family regulator
MDPIQGQNAQRILLVDDNGELLDMMSESLKLKGFEVVTASSVSDALKHIVNEIFDVLITDLQMPNPGDGFTVITAMRHAQPNVLTLLVSGYPDVEKAMATILLEADQVVVKPLELASLIELIHEKTGTGRPVVRLGKQRVGAILEECACTVIANWLSRAKQNVELNHLQLSDPERTGHLAKLVDDLVVRLSSPGVPSKDSDASFSAAAILHGKLRFQQGYTPAMLVLESRILQVTLFGTLRDNLPKIDFSELLTDVMTVADEVDAQLTQTMTSYMGLMPQALIPKLVKPRVARVKKVRSARSDRRHAV